MINQEQLYQTFQQNQFPAFPVIFQQQMEQKQLSRLRTPGQQGSYNIFRKFPQKQIQQLKDYLSACRYDKIDVKYPQLWTDELSKLKLQEFFNNIYNPLDNDFVETLKNDMENIKLCRLGQHKVYIGKIEDQKCSGKCILIFKNGNIYQGQIQQNKRHGKGIYMEPNLGYYKGFFKNDIKEGEGVQILQNKTIYKGNFINGLRHGNNGLYVDLNQNQYFGQWKLGIIHGKGYLKTKNSIYYGVFVNWLKHGHGQQKFIEGDNYKGEYQNGRFDGYGVYRWANGNGVYQGSFKNGFRHGKGKLTENQTKYVGNYVQGLKEGYGQLYFPSGNFYKGNFVNDKRQNYGEMFWTDGSFYKGQWKNGIQNGKGQIYLAGGEIMSGIFQNSILVQVIPSTYEKQKTANISSQTPEFMSSEPRGILGIKSRTYSQSKGFNYKKRLSKIDQNIKKPQYSAAKSKMHFKSPQRSDRSLSKGKDNLEHHYHQGHGHGHGHGGRQCKCVKRLQNFRLKQQTKSKIHDSRFNNTNI